ncbi:hypothetical protein PM082_016568 [Marasmius tenuissimus]|nr:hypothetical protein PM082_016568 [Marasmius tenuissimus]
MTGMQYKEHEAILQVVGGAMLAFQYADITIGLGYPGEKIQNQTIQAVLEEGGTHRPNPFFDFKNDLSGRAPESDLATITFPSGTPSLITRQMRTDGLNDSLRFNVTSASTFILWGSLYKDHYIKRIKIVPRPGPSDLTSTKEILMYDMGPYGDFQQILHWESGLEPLDRETSYSVEISAFEEQQRMASNELQLLDGVSSPSVMNEGHRRHLAPAHIAMIVGRDDLSTSVHSDKFSITKVVAPILFLAAVGVGALWFRPREIELQGSRPMCVSPKIKNAPPSQSLSTSAPTSRPFREVDAGPLPPQYDPLWAGIPSGERVVTSSPSIETAEAAQNGSRKWGKIGRTGRIG